MTQDPKILQRIAEGHYAATALDYLDELLGKLVEESLRASDRLREKQMLTPELAQAVLFEIGAYRTIRARLETKVRRAEADKRAAETSVAPNRDGNDAAPEYN